MQHQQLLVLPPREGVEIMMPSSLIVLLRVAGSMELQ